MDIEDIGIRKKPRGQTTLPVFTRHTLTPSSSQSTRRKSWKETLGTAPPNAWTTKVCNIIILIDL